MVQRKKLVDSSPQKPNNQVVMKTFSRKRLAIAVAVLNCLAFPLAAQNNPPVANNDNYSVSANTTLSVAAPGVLANDSDPNNDALTAMLIGSVTHGTLQLNANGSFTYTPATNFNGTDSFAYAASDGIAVSGSATVTIIVNPANDPPEATSAELHVGANGSLGICKTAASWAPDRMVPALR